MNSTEIEITHNEFSADPILLHTVRSAITATAELLVLCYAFLLLPGHGLTSYHFGLASITVPFLPFSSFLGGSYLINPAGEFVRML